MTKRVFFTAVYLLATSLSGCAAIGPRAEAEKDGDPEWLENLRSLKGTGVSTGVSREAREIEKSLGSL